LVSLGSPTFSMDRPLHLRGGKLVAVSFGQSKR
jgi:hypothetical protein